MQFAKEVPPFQGYIDLIEESPTGTISIVDLKTAARKPTRAQASSNLQLTAYTLGAEALGFDPGQLNLRLDVVTKTKSPELVRFETTRTQQDRERFVKLVNTIWSAIERHAFFLGKTGIAHNVRGQTMRGVVMNAPLYLLKDRTKAERSALWTKSTSRRNPVWFSASVAESNTGKQKDALIVGPASNHSHDRLGIVRALREDEYGW